MGISVGTAQYLCGIDVGTTGSKTMIFSLDGSVAGKAYREYGCQYPKPGWVEQDIDMVLREAFASCREAMERSGIRPEQVAAVSLSTQRTTSIFLDKDEKVLKTISWQDNRTVEEMRELEKTVGGKKFYEMTGLPLNTTWIITKILWMQKNEPELWKKVYRIVQVQDYFLRNLGADDYYIDYPDACLFGCHDSTKHQWNEELMKLAGIDSRLLPIPTPCGTMVGKVSAAAAAATGLAEGTPICVGAGDQNSASIGAGITEEGTVSVSLGTGGMAIACLDHPYRDPLASACVTCHAMTGYYQFEGYQIGAASVFRWFRDEIAGPERLEAEKRRIGVYDLLNEKIAQVPVGAKGLILLPYYGSAASPRWNPDARGTLLGLTFAHDRACIARACMEGITMEQKDILTNMKENKIPIHSVRMIGGATNSKIWNQMQADMYRLPCDTLAVEDAAVTGAALVGGAAVGIFADMKEGVKAMVKVKEHYEPIPENADIYDEMYSIYCKAYESLDQGQVFAELTKFQTKY